MGFIIVVVRQVTVQKDKRRRRDKNLAVGGVSASGASETHGTGNPPLFGAVPRSEAERQGAWLAA